MIGSEFKAWREKADLSQQQVADKFQIIRATIQNWESNVTPIPAAVEMACGRWARRLKQQRPNNGHVTLVYTNRPMFLRPYGERREPAMLQQEPHLSNAAALARIQQLWGTPGFCTPMIVEENNEILWNPVELQKVASGSDEDAPTLRNVLRTNSAYVRRHSDKFVRSGARMLSTEEIEDRQNAIKNEAAKLDDIATASIAAITKRKREIDSVFRNFLKLGTKAPDDLVSAIAQIFFIFERGPEPKEPRLEQGGWALDYRGCVITWPEVRRDSSRWTVNLGSENPNLLSRLGGLTIIDNFESLEGAISQAYQRIDEVV